KAVVAELTDILGPLSELEALLASASRLTRKLISESVDNSRLKQVLLSLKHHRDDPLPRRQMLPRKPKRKISRLNTAIFICVLGTRTVRQVCGRLQQQLEKPVINAATWRLSYVKAYEEVLNIRRAAHQLSAELEGLPSTIRFHLDVALQGSRLEGFIFRLGQGGPWKRNNAEIAHFIVREAVLLSQRLRSSAMSRWGETLKESPYGADQPETLHHVLEAIFYLTHAWTNRTGQRATRKTLKEEKLLLHRANGTLTPQVANTRYEQFITAALDASRPLNKGVTTSLKPYEAQIKLILRNKFIPRPVPTAGMDLT
ncbi:MAG: hypothetical protein K2P94_08520, partial [Rhodospirillaceae bacterium]|nr:hypothetical protein [Rhodospirillaceae bacterium]